MRLSGNAATASSAERPRRRAHVRRSAHVTRTQVAPSRMVPATRIRQLQEGIQAVEPLDLIPLAFFNVLIALLLYTALSGEIGRLRKDIRRFARRQRSDRRRPRSVRDARR